MKIVIAAILVTLSLSMMTSFAASSGDASPIAYPEGYRSWSHVKSELVTADHPAFADIGGFHHIYANEPAMAGYRSRQFPDGAIIVVDWIESRANGAVLQEGARRRIDVMVKDSKRFGGTGGWGFQRCAGDSHTERAAAPTAQQCFACHERLKQDGLVISHYRD